MVQSSPYGQEEGWYLDIMVTIVNLTMSQFQTDILFQIVPISQLVSQVPSSSPNSTFRRSISRFQWLRMISRRLELLRRLVCFSSYGLVWGMLVKPCNLSWIRFLDDCCSVLCIWIIFYSSVLTSPLMWTISGRFLDSVINSSRCHPLTKHSYAIKEFPTPTDKHWHGG